MLLLVYLLGDTCCSAARHACDAGATGTCALAVPRNRARESYMNIVPR